MDQVPPRPVPVGERTGGEVMVQRYDTDEFEGTIPHDDGDWVAYSDYTALEQRCEELERERDELIQNKNEIMEQIKRPIFIGNYVLRNWDREKIVHLCNHLMGDHYQQLEADNALLRKRIAIIEDLWATGDDYVITHINEVRTALMRCVELKEGE